MRSILLSVLIMLLAASNLTAQTSNKTNATVEQEIKRGIRERFDAYARKDVVAWSRFVADECFCASLTKAAIQQEIASRPSNIKNWYGDIMDFQVHVYSDTVVARYRVTEYTELGKQKISVGQWRTETYVRRKGAWLLVGGAESIIPQDPDIAKIDTKIYDAYVGQYEYTPGVIDTVTRDGERLMVQAAGQEGKEELFPENETTFFGKGQDWRLIFVKNEQGRVTAVRFRQNGRDYVAKKIK